MQRVQTFSDGSQLYFDKGLFDQWCVWYENTKGQRAAPLDVDYFARLQKLSKQYGAPYIYGHFVSIYEQTHATVEPKVLEYIAHLATQYPPQELLLQKLFTVLYAGMIAEENKAGAILKKRIKRLGMHQVLMEHMSPLEAAHFSKGKKWQELDAICKAKGF